MSPPAHSRRRARRPRVCSIHSVPVALAVWNKTLRILLEQTVISTPLHSKICLPETSACRRSPITRPQRLRPGHKTVPLTAALGNLTVGQTLTIDPGTASEENVLVTAIDDAASPQTFTATFASAHIAGTSIVSQRKQTLGEYYGNFITQLGFDGQAATTGTTTQTNLASTLETQRQGVNGINLDQETQNLIQYQTAYTAAAKTFTVLQSLLSTIMQTI